MAVATLKVEFLCAKQAQHWDTLGFWRVILTFNQYGKCFQRLSESKLNMEFKWSVRPCWAGLARLGIGYLFTSTKSREDWSSRMRGQKRTHAQFSNAQLFSRYANVAVLSVSCPAFCIWKTAFQISNKPQIMDPHAGIENQHSLLKLVNLNAQPRRCLGETNGHMYQCMWSFHVLHWRVERHPFKTVKLCLYINKWMLKLYLYWQ